MYLLYILLLTACKKGHNNYKIEDALYNCEKEHYKSVGLDIEAVSDSLEAAFIRQGIMKDCSGESILNVWATIEAENIFPTIIVNTELLQKFKLLSGFDARSTCPDVKDEFFEDSTVKIFRLMVGMLYIKNPTPQNIAQLWLRIFTAEDFEHPLYKLRFLWLLSSLGNIKEGFNVQFPPLPDSEIGTQYFDKENVLQLFIHQGDSVLLNDCRITIPQLRKKINTFILNKENKGIISIKNEQGASYDFYIKIQDLIRDTYTEIREDYSVKTFGNKLNKLTDEQQQKVREKYPIRISEAKR
jgi:biopolymer transport protein ExbD